MSSWWIGRVDGNWEDFCFLGKLRAFKGFLKNWNPIKRRKVEIGERVRLLDRMEEERSLPRAMREERSSLKGEFEIFFEGRH